MNYGQRPFDYPIAGALPYCTKNLPFPPVQKASSAFVSVTDSGANIQATLAAARPGWANYIEIFKSLGAEGWRWRFSDDIANCLDTTGTGAKFAFPALGGASYVAYAIKVAQLNGVATGRLTHVNGVADTVIDNVGNSRKAIILKNEAAGSWYFYHPELTLGKLLYLEQTTLETTDSTISSVLNNSFVVSSALPSGTYRWIVLADVPGFLGLSGSKGNSSADGPCDNVGMTVALRIRKKRAGSGVAGYYTEDIARNPYNPVGWELNLENPAGDTNLAPISDHLSNCVKERNTYSGFNIAGDDYINIDFAAFPFRYANER
ncbi:MAG: hypothetical protein WCK63_14420 [Betaproteobacteria bacterium]